MNDGPVQEAGTATGSRYTLAEAPGSVVQALQGVQGPGVEDAEERAGPAGAEAIVTCRSQAESELSEVVVVIRRP